MEAGISSVTGILVIARAVESAEVSWHQIIHPAATPYPPEIRPILRRPLLPEPATGG
jgi:hypothetical protein